MLESSGVEYEIFPCDPDLADTTVFCERYGYPPDRSANTILVKAKTGGERFVACGLCGAREHPPRREPHGAQAPGRAPGLLRIGRGDPRGTGMEIGGVTPIALPDGLEVWVDARVMACEWVILGGGERSSKIKAAPALFDRIPGVGVVEGLALDPAR